MPPLLVFATVADNHGADADAKLWGLGVNLCRRWFNPRQDWLSGYT